MALVGQFLDSAWMSLMTFFRGEGFSTNILIPITILVVVGIIGGRIFSQLLSRLLKLTGIDDLAVKADVQKFLRRTGYKGSFSDLVADTFRYFVYLVVVLAIFNILGIQPFFSYLRSILEYFPKLALAISIVFMGLVFFSHAEDFIVGFYRREGLMNVIDGTEPTLPSYTIIAKFIKYLGIISVFVVAMAILGIDVVFLYILTAIITLGTVGMFIVGFSNIFKNIAVSIYLQHSRTFLSGRRINVEGQEGKLVHVTPLYTKIKKGSEYIYIPNTELLNKKVEYEE